MIFTVCRDVIEARIQTYPPGSVSEHEFVCGTALIGVQLNFSLLALHNDPIPDLHKQLVELNSSDNAAMAAEVSAKLDRENHKRQQWAVSPKLLISLR
jgi:ubiquitin carboxyl-terminal hydrolase L5